MVVINNSSPLCNYNPYLSTIFTSTGLLRGSNLPTPTVIVQYIHISHHHMQLKVVKKHKVTELKDHHPLLSLAKEWTDFVLSDKSRSIHWPTLSARPLGAGIPTRIRVSILHSKPWFAETEAPGLIFSTTRDNGNDGVPQRRECLSEATRCLHRFIPMG